MFQISLILISLLLMATALVVRGRRALPTRPRNARASAAARAIVKARVVATAPATAQRPIGLEWTAPLPCADDAPAAEDASARIRDRYIAARFPCVKGAPGLREVEQVIRIARLAFEERKFDRAQELLLLAVEQTPADKSLRLAQLEIAFLAGDAVLFTALARAFHQAMPGSDEWSEVGRLGRVLAPSEPLFGTAPGAAAHAHYGPWPDMPNWIQASWDLTGEVLAADFHRALAHPTGRTGAHDLRRVA